MVAKWRVEDPGGVFMPRLEVDPEIRNPRLNVVQPFFPASFVFAQCEGVGTGIPAGTRVPPTLISTPYLFGISISWRQT